jgi:hypothetical protein
MKVFSSKQFKGLVLGLMAIGGLLVGTPASALTADVCMQTNFLAPHPPAKQNTQALGCTANDVSVAKATNISISAGGECHLVNGVNTCTCNSGQPVTFTADYLVQLTAQARYDIGIYFATDGDSNGDGALTGQCKLTTLDAANSDNFINLDTGSDVCGDIDAAHNPQNLHITLTTMCSPGADGNLKLPNCTSWRQSGANEVCTKATDAYPGSPSKCNCSPGFTVGIFVETATVEVTKANLTGDVPETGGSVTYSVKVKNLAQQATLTLDTLTDSIYGNITTTGHNGITATSCTVGPPPIAAQATYSCEFTVSVGSGQAGTTVADTVTGCGTDSFGHTNLCDTGDASYKYTDVSTTPSLTKTAISATFVVDVTYTVVVTNNSAVDTMTVNSLTDNKFGNIAAVQGNVISTTCDLLVTKTVAPGGAKNCSFVGRITTSPHTNNVTGGLTDDDGVPYSVSDPDGGATVTVNVTFGP